MEILSLFSESILTILIHALPFLLIGSLLSGIIEEFFSGEDISHWLPQNLIGSILVGGLLGFFFPVCDAGVIPLARRLMQKGFPAAVGITFILAAPTLNPIVIFGTLAVYGNGPAFWGRLGISWIVAILVGLIFSFQADPQKLLTVTMPLFEAVSVNEKLVYKGWKERISHVLTVTVDEFFDIGKYIVIGAGLAAICQVWLLPQGDIIQFGKESIGSILTMISLSFIKSAGSAQNAFVGQFYSAILSTGSLTAFLVYGSFIDMKGILTFTRLFRLKTVLYLIVLSLMITIVMALLLNMFFP